jgi:hypothetical protein
MRKHYVAVVHKDAASDFGSHQKSRGGTRPPRRGHARGRQDHSEPTGLSPILPQPDYRTDVLALVPVQLPDTKRTTG